jgi:Ca2+-binding RTX toxin-like protein
VRPGDVLQPRRAGALAGVALAVVLMFALLVAPRAEAGFPGFPGKIAFGSDRDGTPNIYTVNNDGSGLTQLTFDVGGQEGGAQSSDPAWSPDGLKIAYSHYDGADSDIWVMNADGSGKQNLTDSSSNDERRPSFNFQGDRITFDFFDYEEGDLDVGVISATGGGITNLTPDSGGMEVFQDGNPVFSQNGLIYFDSNRSGFVQQVFSMNPDGSNKQQLTVPPGYSREPDPSPDGELVAFSSNRAAPEGFEADLWLMGAFGGSDVVVPTEPDHASRPAFSPGTLRLTFQGLTGISSDSDIGIVGTGGGATTTLAASSGEDEAPDWQPAQYQCWGLAPTIVGAFANSKILGTPGDDVIVGLGGNDVIKGFAGNDKLCGEAGRDKIFGGKGRDVLIGGPGSDQLFGGRGRDKIFGGSPKAKGKNIDGDKNKCFGGKGKDKLGKDCNVKD